MFKRGTVQVEVNKVPAGRSVSEFELPEVEKIVRDRRFRERPPDLFTACRIEGVAPNGHKLVRKNPPTNSSSTSTKNKINTIINDRISQLPDDILHFIISLLPMRQAARTMILSTWWRSLWGTTISCLDLNHPNMTGRGYLNVSAKTNESFNYGRRVDQLLRGRRFPMLDALRVSFSLDKESTPHFDEWMNLVDEWLKLVSARGVKELELDLIPLGFHPESDGYKFHVQGSNSPLKHLQLRFCSVSFPPDIKGFNSLVSLTLESINLNDRLLQNILSNCSSLEWLSLNNIRFSSRAILTFAGPSLLLKHLHLSFSNCSTAEKIYLHDINLLSFELVGSFKTLSIINAPHMAKLVLDKLAPVEVLTGVPRLEILFLTGWHKNFILNESNLPRSFVFNNLKVLVFFTEYNEARLPMLVYLLEACPLLQKLELDMGIPRTRYYEEIKKLITMTSVLGEPHANLKEIDIYGFEGFPERIELSRYLLKKAIVLEKMNIYTATRFYNGNGKWSLFENTVERGRMSLEKVRKLINKDASSSTKLIFVSSHAGADIHRELRGPCPP